MNTFRAEIAHLHVADLRREAARSRLLGGPRARRQADPGCSPLCRAAAVHRARSSA